MVEETRRLSVVDPSREDRLLSETIESQLLIALVNRLGGSLTMPVDEVDGTAVFNLLMGADDVARTFTFRVERKER
ncbi:hypothetical protein MMSR116_29435 [Methylobacterium mesophilicum SR1.6/6]|uniref:Uncharacterized protein n=1 Tax=Methylobacterium mesophilicum SR1.6/6 TaxID=908290 RepID=A0A6B9FSJ3_9HYPH|nr:hypothetical protein [Methylobacterium mesophilicum]QGY05560.1 hypothetical protein MMSR116_29435 [Methylobacterium mesophilicum SR1.6/6]